MTRLATIFTIFLVSGCAHYPKICTRTTQIIECEDIKTGIKSCDKSHPTDCRKTDVKTAGFSELCATFTCDHETEFINYDCKIKKIDLAEVCKQ